MNMNRRSEIEIGAAVYFSGSLRKLQICCNNALSPRVKKK